MNILKSSKDEIEIQIENLTLAELLRVYLNKDPSVDFAAWKRVHPTEKPILKVSTKSKPIKKAISDAIDSIIKDLDNIETDFKKMK
ncbi:MAG: RpoL/Rpb11 RNA polymerase subunit family protein [Candidatus Pacearchaeota archaeon]